MSTKGICCRPISFVVAKYQREKATKARLGDLKGRSKKRLPVVLFAVPALQLCLKAVRYSRPSEQIRCRSLSGIETQRIITIYCYLASFIDMLSPRRRWTTAQ